MTDTIGPVDGLDEQDKQELAQRLVDQAREQGVDRRGVVNLRQHRPQRPPDDQPTRRSTTVSADRGWCIRAQPFVFGTGDRSGVSTAPLIRERLPTTSRGMLWSRVAGR